MTTQSLVTGGDWHVFDTTCLAVEVEVEKSLLDADFMSIGIAVAIGLIVGGLLMLVCAKLCLKDIAKKRYQDAEGGYVHGGGTVIHEKKIKKKTIKKQNKTPAKKTFKKSGKKKVGFAGRKKRNSIDDAGPLLPVTSVSLDDSFKPIPIDTEADVGSGETGEDRSMRGLVDALMQTTGEGMDAEMSGQDLDALTDLERELREESIMTMIQLLRTMLNSQLGKGRLTPEQCKDLMQGVQNDVDEAIKTCQREKEEEEEELKRKIKDPNNLQGEIETLHSKYILRMNILMQGVKDNLRQEMVKKTDLSEEEIDGILSRHADNMAHLEQKMSGERARQAAALEERLARRKQLAESQLQTKQQWGEELDVRQDINQRALGKMVEDGKLLDRQKEELISQYNDDVNRVHNKRKEEHERQQLLLAEKLRKNRERQLQRQQQEQETQREQFLQSSDTIAKPSNLVEGYHGLLEQQRMDREGLGDQLDNQEAEEFHKLAKAEGGERQRELDEVEVKFQDSLRTQGKVSDRDIRHMMQLHQDQMNEYEMSKKSQKKRQRAILEEKLARRKQKQEEQQLHALAEQKAIQEQQDATLNKVLNSQVDMEDDMKEKIIKEHEQNMSVVNNQLQMSRIRQQKLLEQKLNQRKAKVADLKQKEADVKRSKRDMKQKEKEKLEKDLQKQIEAEEKKLEEEKKSAASDLRARLAAETEEALNEESRQMGLIIARLQVGQARRQAYIMRQDKTIKELEEKLVDRVAEKERDDPGPMHDEQINHVLNEHYNQVTELTDKMQDVRDRQAQVMREKLEAKKIRKERDVEEQLEHKAQEDWAQQKRRGAGVATALLGQAMLDTRHRMAMEQLEKEMQQEMMRQQDELNRELERELEDQLEEQKKTFIAQIAAVTNMSKDDVNDLVENAVIDTGGNAKEAKKLAKDLRLDMQRAKTELHIDQRGNRRPSNEGYNMRRANTELRDSPPPQRSRPASAARPRPRSAFREH